jgi:hypothetical protein
LLLLLSLVLDGKKKMCCVLLFLTGRYLGDGISAAVGMCHDNYVVVCRCDYY